MKLGKKTTCLCTPVLAWQQPILSGGDQSRKNPEDFSEKSKCKRRLHLNLGAPGLGLFACSKKYIRQMPGRLVGKTIDSKNNQGFVLTLSTREQHIRRERATSNICTNHNLMALAFSITISLYGKKGFYDLAVKNIKQAMFFRKEAINAGLKIKFKGPHFNESVIVFSSQKQLEEKLNKLSNKKIFAGCSLFRWYPEFNGCLLVTTTELHNIIDINELIKGLL